jgi:hypothetical protein
MSVPKVSGSMSTTRSNSRPLASTGDSDRMREVGRKAPAGRSATPITLAIPSSCAASQVSRIAPSSDADRCTTGAPLLRTEVGTLASGRTARMTGSASAITSAGVR